MNEFFSFRSSFIPNFVRLCRRHPRGELEAIFEWVLPMAKVRRFSLGHPLEKAYKTRKTNLGI
jgi:hypothetical protein